MSDGIGNDISLDYEDIQNLGFSTEFEVINSNVDITPPELKRFEFSEDKFDVSYGDATADVTFQFTDDKSGLINQFSQFNGLMRTVIIYIGILLIIMDLP